MAQIGRRAALAGTALALGVAAAKVGARTLPTPPPHAPPAPPSTPSVADRLVALVRPNLHPIAFDGTGFSGAGWDMLVAEGRESAFFLIGEEHGIAEIPVLTGALFAALQPAGYSKLVIELSAPVADDLDAAAKQGLGGLKAYFDRMPPGPAFYFWQPEADLLARVRALVPPREQAIWGLDYEVLGERPLIARLVASAPASARPALAALDSAVRQGWARWRADKDPGQLPMFALDPALVRAVQDAWPSPDAQSAVILDVLAETLEINRLQQTSGWASNKRRADFNRRTLVRLLSAAKRPVKAVIKMGSNHVMRGVTWTGQFDVGSLAAEAAALRGSKSFHLLAGGGAGGQHGSLDPVTMGVTKAPADMLGPEFGLQFLLDAMPRTGLALLDLRPLRRLASSPARLKELNNPEAVRVIHAYDAMLVWNGSTATASITPFTPAQ